MNKKLLLLIKTFFLLMIIFLIGRGIWLNLFMKPFVSDQKLDFEIQEVSKAAGINFTHSIWTLNDKRVQTILPWLTSTGASASVVDINNDGWPDIYLISSSFKVDNRLYINQKNGTFREEASEYGLGAVNNENLTLRAIFFDADNDGTKEMLQLTQSCPILYKQGEDKKYHPVADFYKENTGCYISNSVNVIDYDNDGLLDIVYAGILPFDGKSNFILPENLVLSENGALTTVLHNEGNLHFKEEHILSRQKMHLFTMAIGVGDLRGENKKDIWFSTDFHQDQVFLKENNGYSFNEDSIENVLSKFGMSAEIGYIDNTKKPFVFVTHMYKQGFAPHGNAFYHYEDSKFRDHASEYGLSRCGWGWGAKFFDVNNDGNLDLYIANGMFGIPAKKDFWFKFNTIFASNTFILRNLEWRPTMQGHNFSGHERDCLFINQKGKFVDMANRSELHIDEDLLDGRSVGLIDFLNNGSQGLVVTNQKQRVYLYNVIQKNNNHWLGLKLTGRKSNRDAIGTKVLLYRKGEPLLIRENEPFNGFSSQNDERLHFGLGSYNKEVKLEIHWPSGKIQLINVDTLDRYINITENE